MKLWGDTSGHFGYQINQGSVNVLGLNQEIKEGQHLDAYINESAYPNNEAYAAFTKYEQSVTVGKAVNLCLNEAGYDESWNIVMNPCGDATITIDGVATKTKTDTKGNAKITINKIGTHIVSAEKVKEINLTEGEDTVTKQVTAITAPVCTVTVKAPSVGKVSISKVVPGKKQAKVSWKAVKGASGYQVAYKRSGKATKYTTASKSPKTIKKLKKGKKYTFKVRAYVKVGSKKYYGAWSKSITKKIK